MLYRLITEDINRQGVCDIVAVLFPGFTMIPAIGYWQGVRENSLIIEIVTDDEFPDERTQGNIRAIAISIQIANKQNAVMITETESRLRFI